MVGSEKNKTILTIPRVVINVLTMEEAERLNHDLQALGCKSNIEVVTYVQHPDGTVTTDRQVPRPSNSPGRVRRMALKDADGSWPNPMED